MDIIRPAAIDDTILTASNIAETDHAAYNAATNYALGDYCIRTTSATHRIYQSLVGANVGNTPEISPTKWQDIGATDRWRMFDSSNTSQSSNANSIDITLTAPAGRINAVYLGNVSAAGARVIVTDAIDGVVYDETKSLISDSGITDWYSYFFEPIVRRKEVAFTDLPPYSSPTVEIILADAGNTVLCGNCIVGQQAALGDTQFGVKLGISDYSVKTKDEFGVYTVTPRDFSKQGGFSLWVPNTYVDQLMALLEQYRATPIVYIGDLAYDAAIMFGYYEDFSVVISLPTESVCDLTIEGLT